MEYKFEYNELIISTIEKSKEGFLGYNELYKLLKKEIAKINEKIISKKTYNYHLQFLEKQKIIIKKSEHKPGHNKQTLVYLHPDTITKRKIGIFTIDYMNVKRLGKDTKKGINEYKKEKRKNRLILFLLFAIAYDYHGYKIKKTKPEAGDFVIPDPKIPNKFLNASSVIEQGFSPLDLSHNSNDTTIQRILQSHKFTKSEANNILKELQSIDVDIQTILSSSMKTIRYDIKDEFLKEFLLNCMMILDNLVRRMQYYFWFSHKNKPRREESNWYYIIFGEKTAISFFTKILDNNSKKKSDKDLWIEFNGLDIFLNNPNLKIPIEKFLPSIPIKKKVNELIQNHDRSIKKHIKFIGTKKFPKIIEKREQYTILLEEIKKIIYPEFLRNKYKIKEELTDEDINEYGMPIFVLD